MLRRADAVEFLERAGKVAFIPYAHLIHDLLHSQASVLEKVLCLLHPEVQKILVDGRARSRPEQAA